MKPARFDYLAPQSVEEALAALAAHGEDAKIIAGGQSLVPMMNMRLAQPPVLIDINALPDLASVRDEGEHLAIGALIRHHDLAHHEIVRALCPVLAEAAATIGYYAIRQRGTLGGSLVHADPAAQLPLIAVLLDAEMELASPEGSRRVPASDFFLSVFTTSIEPTEILTACRVPKRPPNAGWGFAMFSAVSGDYAIASAAATLRRDTEGRIAQLRVAVGSIGAVPLRVGTEAALGAEPSSAWIKAFAAQTVEALEIEDSVRISAEYRRDIASAMIEDALTAAVRRSV
jgi:carbon-monoxide dehydrogenase medium subunit